MFDRIVYIKTITIHYIFGKNDDNLNIINSAKDNRQCNRIFQNCLQVIYRCYS